MIQAVKRIEESCISMEGFDLQDILSTFLAPQLPKKPFEPYRQRLAKHIVGAVLAMVYDYADEHPFIGSMCDFEDGYDLIEVKKFIEEIEMYLPEVITSLRSALKDYTLVVGGRTLYTKIIQYLFEKAEDVDKDSQPIIKAFAEAIQTFSDKTCENVGCDIVNKPSQKHALALGEGDIWEPPSRKIIVSLEQLSQYGSSYVVPHHQMKKIQVPKRKRKRAKRKKKKLSCFEGDTFISFKTFYLRFMINSKHQTLFQDIKHISAPLYYGLKLRVNIIYIYIFLNNPK